MASSSGDRDQDPTVSRPPPPNPPSPPKSDNPFIKFRDFADAQVSALLQGIIGLPSALSRAPAENARWAVFDDDLRRRDELQARQRELKESEARRASEARNRQADTPDEVPVKKSVDWKATPSEQKTTIPATNETEEDVTMDVPLYSPVPQSLFAHLRPSWEIDPSWPTTDGPTTLRQALWGGGFTCLFGFHGSPEFKTPMGQTQQLAYRHLLSFPFLRSEYSLLPYLLFSRYSPLKLSGPPSLSASPEEKLQSLNDNFPYCEAFEDLIRTSMNLPADRYFGFKTFSEINKRSNSYTAARNNLDWIEYLYSTRLLQQSQVRSDLDFSTPGNLTRLLFQLNGNQRLVESQEVKEAETEQELYDHFLSQLSSEHLRSKALAMLIKDSIKDMESHEDDDEASTQNPSDENTLPRTLQAVEALLSGKSLGECLKIAYPEIAPKDYQKTLEDYKPHLEQAQDPERVVSTTTTTEHTRHEDGSAETHVTVWKRFADGRETTTTTTHCDEPALDAPYYRGNWEMADRQEASTEKPENGLKENKKTDEKKDKKGWFWN